MLILTWFLVTVALFALFWGGALVAQGYMYNQPVDRLPARAAAAAVLVGTFLSLWVAIDRGAPGKYDTFFEFGGETRKEFDEFEAVRWSVPSGRFDADKDPPETTAKFKKAPGGKAGAFVEVGSGQPFRQNDTSTMTAVLVVKTDDGPPVRFKAKMDVQTKADPNSQQKYRVATYTNDRVFVEENGSRYIKADQLGVVYVPSTGTVFVALLINFLHMVVWFVAFWLVLRFNWGHALGFAAVFGLLTMLAIMPLLFKPNRATQAAAPTARTWHLDRERLV